MHVLFPTLNCGLWSWITVCPITIKFERGLDNLSCDRHRLLVKNMMESGSVGLGGGESGLPLPCSVQAAKSISRNNWLPIYSPELVSMAKSHGALRRQGDKLGLGRDRN